MTKRRIVLRICIWILLSSATASLYGLARAYASPAIEYDYVDSSMSDVDFGGDKGEHSNFVAQQYGPDTFYDILNEEDTGGGITYDNSGESYSATGQSYHSFDYSLQKSSGNDRLVVVTVSWEDAQASAYITSMTFDSIPMFHILEVTVGTSASYSEYISLWYLLDSSLPSSTGSYNVAVAVSESITREIYIAVAEYSAVKQSAPDDFDADANTSAGDTSITLTAAADGSLVVAAVGEGGTRALSNTNTIINLQEQVLTSSGSALGHQTNVDSGDIAVGWNNLATREGMVGAVWQPSNINFELDLEVQWTSADYTQRNEELCIFGGTMGSENIRVEVWSDSTWHNLFANLSAGWNNISVTEYLDSPTFTIRFRGATETVDPSQDSWEIDCTLLHTWRVVPTADFSYTPEYPAAGETVTFNASDSHYPDGSIASHFWDFGDGKTSSTQNTIHRYQAPGTYTVSLTITDDYGATDRASKKIMVIDVTPPETIDDYDGSWHTSDFTINLTATDEHSGIQGIYYKINDGQAMNVQSHGQPRFSNEGYSELEYWSVDLYGNEETHHIIEEVKLDKTSPIAVAGLELVVHEDMLLTFDGSNSYDNIGITNHTWAFFDGTLQTLSGAKTQYIFHSPGAYTVYLTVSDAALNYATDTVAVNVLDVTKPIANAGNDQVVYEDVAVLLDGSGSLDNVEVVSYLWTFLDATPKALLGVNSTHIFKVPSVYNITLTVSDAEGNSANDFVTITVIDATWPAANAGLDRIVDEDTLVDFDGSASTDNVEITSYAWTFADRTPQRLFGVSPSYTFETPGIYTVTLKVTDGEGHFTTDTVVITVRDTTPPLVDTGKYQRVVENTPVSFDASESCDNVGAVYYNWDFGDSTFENSTIPSVIHIYTKPGVYTGTLVVVDESGNVNSASISVVVLRDTDGDFLADYLDPDDDEDGIPDDWEILHGLDPFDPSDAALDQDGDGLSSLTEYQRDSDPKSYTFSSSFSLFDVLTLAATGLIFAGIHVWFVRILRRNSRKAI